MKKSSDNSDLSDSEVLESKDGCIASAMTIIGNKWTALILRALASGPKRFSELEKSIPTINPRILSQRLDGLEKHGILSKLTPPGIPVHNVYLLATKGE